MEYDKIEQGTEDWLRIKWGKIGGSNAHGLLIESEKLETKIISEHIESFELDIDSFTSPEMQRGIELEPEAAKAVALKLGIPLETVGWIQHDKIDILGVSPDRLSGDRTIAVEIKCPSKERHTETVISNRIPHDNISQCIHYFTCIPKLQTIYFCSFRPESMVPLVLIKLTRNDLINLGSASNPNVKRVSEWCNLAEQNAIKIQNKIKNLLTKIRNDF